MRRLNCDMLGESSGKGISLFPCFYRVVCGKQASALTTVASGRAGN